MRLSRLRSWVSSIDSRCWRNQKLNHIPFTTAHVIAKKIMNFSRNENMVMTWTNGSWNALLPIKFLMHRWIHQIFWKGQWNNNISSDWIIFSVSAAFGNKNCYNFNANEGISKWNYYHYFQFAWQKRRVQVAECRRGKSIKFIDPNLRHLRFP